jgi:hypothetical protein
MFPEITLEAMRNSIRWCLPDAGMKTIQVWFDRIDNDQAYHTYGLGDQGLNMLYANHYLPVRY